MLRRVLREVDGRVGLQAIDAFRGLLHVVIGQASHEFSGVGFLQGAGDRVEIGEPPVGVDRTPPELQTGNIERAAVVAQAEVPVVVHPE